MTCRSGRRPALDDRRARLLARVIARPEPEARIGLLQRTRAIALVERADRAPEVAGAAARLWPPREQDPGFAG